MKSFLRRRPSPAMIVALVALFVSLSGVSYGVATGFIDSREIKNNEVRSIDIRNNEVRTRDLRNNEVRGIDIRNSTVQGRDIALNTVTGDDVREDTLQKVPSALLADSATTATTANQVSTLKIVPFTKKTEGNPGTPTTLLTHGPLKLTAYCLGSGAQTGAELFVETEEEDSASGAAGPPSTAGSTRTYRENEDLDVSDGEMSIVQGFAEVATPRTAFVAYVFASAPSG